MKVMKIGLGSESVSLRLTASKLAAYASEIGSSGNTLFAVLDALDDVDKQGKLLTAALTYNGNGNSIKDGFDLIDMLADADYSPIRIKELIVSLAVDSGVIGRDDAAKLKAAMKTGSEKLYAAAVAVLSGDVQNLTGTAEQPAEGGSENPT